jgi:hypothetical protein
MSPGLGELGLNILSDSSGSGCTVAKITGLLDRGNPSYDGITQQAFRTLNGMRGVAAKTGMVQDLSGRSRGPDEGIRFVGAAYPTRFFMAAKTKIVPLTHRTFAQKLSDSSFMWIMAGSTLDRIGRPKRVHWIELYGAGEKRGVHQLSVRRA